MNTLIPEQLAKLPKWAREHFIETEHQCAINRALAWQSYTKPKLFPANEINFPELKVLWFQHYYGERYEISEGCSNGSSHSRNNPATTTSQGAGMRLLATV